MSAPATNHLRRPIGWHQPEGLDVAHIQGRPMVVRESWRPRSCRRRQVGADRQSEREKLNEIDLGQHLDLLTVLAQVARLSGLR